MIIKNKNPSTNFGFRLVNTGVRVEKKGGQRKRENIIFIFHFISTLRILYQKKENCQDIFYNKKVLILLSIFNIVWTLLTKLWDIFIIMGITFAHSIFTFYFSPEYLFIVFIKLLAVQVHLKLFV